MELVAFLVAFLAAAYVLGAIPFGYLVARSKGIDILSEGSKSIGATNVARVLGKGPGTLVFILDVLKGAVPAGIAHYYFRNSEWALYVGAAALLGHTASPFLRFKGGKGIATGLGMLLGSAPLVAVSALGAFIVFVVFTRWVSLSSLVAAVAMVVFGFVYGQSLVSIIVYALLAAYIFYRHRANIKRLLNGTEPRFKFGSKKTHPEGEDESGTDRTGEDEGGTEREGGGEK
jgi:glycerol-3-phosphate acyltransferase PlsY